MSRQDFSFEDNNDTNAPRKKFDMKYEIEGILRQM